MRASVLPPLVNWSVVCLRPAPQQAAVRRAVRARGARHVALPGLRLAAMPASAFAVGAGTARALARHGIDAISPPHQAMHSEGLLALPEWNDITGPVGLVTAPGGRGIIPAGLARRGLEIRRAEVYRRLPPRLDARHRHALMQSPAPRAALISSAEALDGALDALPEDGRRQLLDSLAVTCSPRLAELARARGFLRVTTACAPTAAAMLDALEAWAKDNGSTGFR